MKKDCLDSLIDLEISYSLLLIFYDMSDLQTQKRFNRIDRIRTFHFKLDERSGYQILLKLASLFTNTICKRGCLNSKISINAEISVHCNVYSTHAEQYKG